MAEPAAQDSRVRLGKFITERRLELHMSVSEAAARAQVDRGTWSAAEAGTRSLAAPKRRAIEDVLEWVPGSIDGVLRGSAPVPRIRMIMPGGASVPRAPRAPLDLATEVRRIRALNISAAAKIEMVQTMIDLFGEAQAEAEADDERPTA